MLGRFNFSCIITLLICFVAEGRNCATRDPSELEQRKADEVVQRWRAIDNGASRGKININVYWHTIHKGSKGHLPSKIVKKSIDILNDAFSPHFSFTIVEINVIGNKDYWYINYGQDLDMKKALRKGDCGDLNVYSTSLSFGLLGWATFPHSCSKKTKNDGVVILYKSTPGGDSFPYDEGDTLTHEVGHWLGLYHTFDGGCSNPGDHVADTPRVASPNFGCEVIDSCPHDGQGNDMIENFMDYTTDACMTKFTNGQFTRMVAMWNEYRDESATKAPTTRAPNPAPKECPGNKKPFVVEVKTDTYGEDISFFLQMLKGNKPTKKKMFRRSRLEPNKKQRFETCLLRDKCYKFTMTDSFGDGLCCSYGRGYYKLIYGGEQVLRSTFELMSREMTKFGC